MSDSIIIHRRFRGPPESGNGGYTCGILGALRGGTTEVTLVAPPPLERELRIEHAPELTLLKDGENLIAKARDATLELQVPHTPSFDEAEECSRHYRGFEGHIYPECFVCGPARETGDGLRIFAAHGAPHTPVAAPWVPDASLADGHGNVLTEFVWAALDCPGYFALDESVVAVLGRMTAAVVGTVKVGERCSIIGWKLAAEGRKYTAATALFSSRGELVASSKQIWVRLQ